MRAGELVFDGGPDHRSLTSLFTLTSSEGTRVSAIDCFASVFHKGRAEVVIFI